MKDSVACGGCVCVHNNAGTWAGVCEVCVGGGVCVCVCAGCHHVCLLYIVFILCGKRSEHK